MGSAQPGDLDTLAPLSLWLLLNHIAVDRSTLELRTPLRLPPAAGRFGLASSTFMTSSCEFYGVLATRQRPVPEKGISEYGPRAGEQEAYSL
jgi:hypothetical protein